MSQISNLNNKVKSLYVQSLQNENQIQKLRNQIKKREENANRLKQNIGTLVRNKYFVGNRSNEIAMLLGKHGGLSTKNLHMAAEGLRSVSFARAARNKAMESAEKVQKYKNTWRAWFKGLSENNRTKLRIEIRKKLGHASANEKYVENPLFFISRALTFPFPIRPNNNRKFNYRYAGSKRSLMELSDPNINAILRKYGLPFSMASARNALLNAKGINKSSFDRALTRGRINEREYRKIPLNMSFQGGPRRPPKGLKGYAGKRARRG